MAKIDYPQLEKNTKLKRFYLSKIPWWLNSAILSPVLLIFIGVVGILYYTNIESLYEWHTLPYVILFVLGVIVLLYVKSALQKKYLNDKDSFRCCASYLIGEYKGFGYYVFSTEQRYSESWIEKQAKSLSFDDIEEETKMKAKKIDISVASSENQNVLLRAVNLAKLNKDYGTKTAPLKIVMLYITEKYTYPVRLKYL